MFEKYLQQKMYFITIIMYIDTELKFLIKPLGNTFQAIVSVIAVNTQFNSPNIVRLSFKVPGILEQTKINQ